MSAYRPKLRGHRRTHRGPWPVGDLPNEAVVKVGSDLVLAISRGAKDISGDDFANMLAFGVDGSHRDRPLGVVDVIKDDFGWSAKTVKSPSDPHK